MLLPKAFSGTGNMMLPYPHMPTQPSASSNPSTAYHGSSNTPYPLYNNQFPTPSPYPTNTANTSNFSPYTPPYPTQNCPYPQQPMSSIRPEYPSYPSAASTSPNTTSGVRTFRNNIKFISCDLYVYFFFF